MRLASLILITVTALLPVAAGAVDVNLGVKVEGVYDSNVFRTSRDQKQDGSFRFTPDITIEVPGKKFSGNLFYAPTYEVFTTYSDANGLTHDVSNLLNWKPGEKTNVSLKSRFRVLDVLNNGDFDTIDEGTAPIPDKDITRERVNLFGSGLAIVHAISPRWDSNTNIDFNLFNSERRLTTDSKSISAAQRFEYGLTASDRVGGGVAFSGQFFDAVAGLPASNTFVYNFFANYSHNFGERTIVSLRLGPALIHTIQDSFEQTSTRLTYPHLEIEEGGVVIGVRIPDSDDCLMGGSGPVLFEGNRCALNDELLYDPAPPPDNPGGSGLNDTINLILDDETDLELIGSDEGSNDMRWTLFGEISLTHYWLQTLTSTLSYNRRESPTNGQGTSTVADSVFFTTTWQPSELWDLSMRASYVRRESPTNLSRQFAVVEGEDRGAANGGVIVKSSGLKTVVEKSDGIDTHRWAVTMRAARRITRRISGSVRLSYTDQRSKHTSRNPNDFGDFLAIVGVKYDFDAFRF